MVPVRGLRNRRSYRDAVEKANETYATTP